MYQAHYDVDARALLFVDGEKNAGDYLTMGINVFVCGGLMNPVRMGGLIGRNAPFAPAIADGYTHRHVEASPFMLPDDDPSAALLGVVYLGLSSAEVARVETLELDGGYRKQIPLEVRVGDRICPAISYTRA
ncbi:MAG TPA: gamma-glutamylcyclotransferase [bacterium]|nr:gamma-glutamylcyclotransferase [bacterium]